MRIVTDMMMWGHASGCHRYCCGFCSCGYERVEYDDDDRRRVVSDILKSKACNDFVRVLRHVAP